MIKEELEMTVAASVKRAEEVMKQMKEKKKELKELEDDIETKEKNLRSKNRNCTGYQTRKNRNLENAVKGLVDAETERVRNERMHRRKEEWDEGIRQRVFAEERAREDFRRAQARFSYS